MRERDKIIFSRNIERNTQPLSFWTIGEEKSTNVNNNSLLISSYRIVEEKKQIIQNRIESNRKSPKGNSKDNEIIYIYI